MRKNHLIFISVLVILISCSVPKINTYNTNAEKEGIWVELYGNGNIKELTTFKNGKKNGIYIYYSESGEILTKGNFKNDKTVGKWMIYDKETKTKHIINKNKTIPNPPQW